MSDTGEAERGRSGPGGKIGVFLLDDHEIVRRGVRELLEAEPDIVVVGEAGTAASALARIPALRPDVAVLDGPGPGSRGLTTPQHRVRPSAEGRTLLTGDGPLHVPLPERAFQRPPRSSPSAHPDRWAHCPFGMHGVLQARAWCEGGVRSSDQREG
jgi:hypothetical protein